MSAVLTVGRLLLIGAGALLVLALVAVALKAFLPISTPAFRDAQGRLVPNSIAAIERWPVNGVDQSVILRGRDASNPVLLWIHGGPGSSETPILRRFNGCLLYTSPSPRD